MRIVIPLRGTLLPRASRAIQRGQLYNLDLNQFIGLQFNPRGVEPSVDFGWGDDSLSGTDKTDTQFLGQGQTEFELLTEWIVDPGAPLIEHNVGETCVERDEAGNRVIRIEQVILALERWAGIQPDTRRPSLIRVISAEGRVYDGRLTRMSPRTEERFASGQIRRATIRMGFKEWRRVSTSS